MADTLLDGIKTALRISHDLLDAELTANISEARAEMVRAGIDEAVSLDETNPLITGAIKTYCKMINASDTKQAEGLEKSWTYQLDNLRKSTITVSGDGEGNV